MKQRREVILPLAAALAMLGVPPLKAADSRDLFAAIRAGDHAQVQRLLHAGADANAADADGTTALMHSVIESDGKMMALLLTSGAGVNATNALGSTALMYAAVNLEKSRLLLDR